MIFVVVRAWKAHRSLRQREFGLLMSDIIHVLLPHIPRIRRFLVLVLGDSSAGGWEPPADASSYKHDDYSYSYTKAAVQPDATVHIS